MIDINSQKENFKKVMDRLQHELSSVRTGRANPALLATVMVESYGSRLPLEQVASITVSDAKSLAISPWDKGQLGAVEKGIMEANLGFTPSNDGTVIRITLPPMSEDRRRDMVKVVGQMAEQARIGIRQVREDILKAVKNDKDAGKDEIQTAQKKVQDLVDEYNKQIKELAEDKEKEVMTV